LDREEALRFDHEADTVLTGNERSKMLELTTSWKEEGRVEGRTEGRHEECVRLVLRLSQRRFGPLDALVEGQINALSLDRLESLAEALLDFATVSELIHWLRRP
jgi:hypothetical protein